MQTSTHDVLAEIATMRIEQWPIDQVKPYDNNPRKRTEAATAKLAGLIKRFGFNVPIVVDEEGVILAGHGRRLAALHPVLDLKVVPVVVKRGMPEAEKMAWRIADNRIAEDSEWDEELLAWNVGEIERLGVSADELTASLAFDGDELGKLLEGIEVAGGAGPAAAKAGKKREAPARKLTINLADRFEVAPNSVLDTTASWWRKRSKAWIAELGTKETDLDPTLAELIVRWFSPPGGLHTGAGDTFARVAEKLGRQAANGDPADLAVFAVPPPAQNSLDDWHGALQDALRGRIDHLKPGRFFVVAVGDHRGADGAYIGMPSIVVESVLSIGLKLHNEAIIVGRGAKDAGAAMHSARRLHRNHETMLVFVRGDPAVAVQEMGACEFAELEGEDAEPDPSDPDAGLKAAH